MGVIKNDPPYVLRGKLRKQAEILVPAMNADRAPKVRIGRDGHRKIYLVRRHAYDDCEKNIIGTIDFPKHGSFLIADAL